MPEWSHCLAWREDGLTSSRKPTPLCGTEEGLGLQGREKAWDAEALSSLPRSSPSGPGSQPPAYWMRVHVSEAFPWGRQANCSPWTVLTTSHTLLGTYYVLGTVTYLFHVHHLTSLHNKPSMR